MIKDKTIVYNKHYRRIILFLPSIFSTIMFLLFIFFAKIPGAFGFFLVIYSLYLIIPAIIALVILCVYLACAGFWEKSISILLIPLLPLFLAYFFRNQILFGCDLAHLIIEQSSYERQIANLPAPNGKKFTNFDWSIGFAGGPITLLVYDETDEIMAPWEQQTHNPNRESGGARDCAGKAEHLFGHYYVCTF